jgi:hypothetical protein
MHARFSKYVSVLLFLAIGVIAGCGERERASPTSPSVLQSAIVTAEPSVATAELVPDRFCPAGSTLGVRIIITIGGRSEVIARGLQFEFTDRFGHRAVPVAFSTSTSTTATGADRMPLPIPTQSSIPIPTLGSIPIPGSSPIPIPAASPIPGVQIPAGASHTVPIFLQFGCGVMASGTLVVSVDTTDMQGMSFTSHARVRVDG